MCAHCGTRAPEEPGGVEDGGTVVPLTWTSAVENGRLRYFCPTCSRENLRAIEGKLDSEWW